MGNVTAGPLQRLAHSTGASQHTQSVGEGERVQHARAVCSSSRSTPGHAQRLDGIHQGREVCHKVGDAAAEDHCGRPRKTRSWLGVLVRPRFHPQSAHNTHTQLADAPPLRTTPVTRLVMEDSATAGNL
jgi:hypothetical protein